MTATISAPSGTRPTLRSASPAKTRSDVVVAGVVSGAKQAEAAPGSEDIVAAYGRKFRPMLAALGVTGKAGEVNVVPTGGTIAAPVLILVGLGSEATARNLRKAAGNAARSVKNATSVALALPCESAEQLAAIVTGWRLGGYSFHTYKSGPAPEPPATVSILTASARTTEFQETLERTNVIVDAVLATRELVNIPPGDLTPPAFADALVAAHADLAATPAGSAVTITVHDEHSLAELGCGGILGVGSASAAPPRLVELSYQPEGIDDPPHLALVGKGITFDSGGLTIKPAGSMRTMKCDMAGAAAVASATFAIARLGLPVRISAFMPMAENMVDGAAFRPGDVLGIYGGHTVEITNTDAEGRLILADALGRAVEVEPDAIIDVATLTGHMVMALGDLVAGVMGNSDGLIDQVLDAAQRAGEPLWPLPIPEEMYDRLKANTVADVIQHDWVRYGGGLFAAGFLEYFVAGLPWAHLDIAGPAFHSGGANGHIVAGGTGYSVATLIELAQSVADESAAPAAGEEPDGNAESSGPTGWLRQLTPRSFMRRL